MSKTVEDDVGRVCEYLRRVREARGLFAVIGVQIMREPKRGLARRRPTIDTVWFIFFFFFHIQLRSPS